MIVTPIHNQRSNCFYGSCSIKNLESTLLRSWNESCYGLGILQSYLWSIKLMTKWKKKKSATPLSLQFVERCKSRLPHRLGPKFGSGSR